VTERELSQARNLHVELDALRRVAIREPSPEVLRSIDRQAKAVESARLEVMAFIATVPDPRIRAIAVMRFLEGKSWETIARRMHYERTSLAKQLRRFLRGRM
jgi:DNA-directed RNA polymerase specialized sigma24 family protein